MKEQGKANKILYIIVAVIIILGAIFYSTKKFNMEPIYSNREQIVLSNNTEFDAGKVEEIARSVLNRKVIIKKVERFGNSVQIISDTISEEEKTNIVNRVNEECGLNIQNDDTKITKVANTRIIDEFVFL